MTLSYSASNPGNYTGAIKTQNKNYMCCIFPTEFAHDESTVSCALDISCK